MRSRLLGCLVVAVVLFLGSPSRADIHAGFALIIPGPAWDFSDSTLVVPPNGDLRWITVLANSTDSKTSNFSYFFVTDFPAMIAYASADSSYEELTSAPSDSSVYAQSKGLYTFAVYVVRTKEGHYAKLRVFMLGGGMTIEYTYQDDGTRILRRPVGVKATTWGKVKSLYGK